MAAAPTPSVGRKPAMPLAGQLAHESYVRPGPLVLGTAFLRSPTAASDRDRTVSRVIFPYYYGHRLYLHPISRGWRVMASVGVHGLDINLKKPSLRCCWRRSRYRGTTRPCYVDVAQHLRRIFASFSNSLGLQKRQLLVLVAGTLRDPSLDPAEEESREPSARALS